MNATPKKAANTRFAPLFTLAITHQYVDGGPYDAFSVTPLGATEKVLRRHGWVGAQSGNKFTLYADPSHPKPSVSLPLSGPDLFYAIEFRDSAFPRYTNLPMQAGSVLSLTASPAAKPAKPQQAGATPMPHTALLERVAVQDGIFTFPWAGPAMSAGFWLADLSGEKARSSPAPVGGSVKVDTSGLDPGLYRILKSEKIISSFIKMSPLFRLPLIATLSISLNQMVNKYRILQGSKSTRDDSNDSPISIQLDLGARSTTWRYDIFNHGSAKSNQFQVQPVALTTGTIQAAQQPTFQLVPGIVGPSGETSLAFESSNPIPMQSAVSQRFMLTKNQNTLIPELPTPDLETGLTQGKGGLCSNLFVYL